MIKAHGTAETAVVLDRMKTMGFRYATQGAITISISDMIIPEVKARYLEETEGRIENIVKTYKRGLISEDERYRSIVEEWNRTTDDIQVALMASLDKFNPLYMMSNSGARGTIVQIKQLAGMRGLVLNTTGKTIEMPIKSNFREGLKIIEFFISTHGARKGNADTALRTADSGYLTRRLVDVSQELIVREEDCGSADGIEVSTIYDGNEVIEPLRERLVGRYPSEAVTHPETGEEIVGYNELMDEAIASEIEAAGIKKVKIRSVLNCRLSTGVCSRCYGSNLATGGDCDVGEAIGIIAAQSIGEPGTQLTMRTFHTGGVAGDDITQGLPRVEELFEARKPKGLAIISEIAGKVSMNETKKKKEIVVTGGDGEARSYMIPFGSRLKVWEGDEVEAGDELTEGSINPQDILRIKGTEGVQAYLLQEVQRVYRLQGVDINDKHIEVIVKQMMRKVKVEDAGETGMLPGALMDMYAFERENARAAAEGREEAVGKRSLLGITRASLSTESFLSAASFQETTKVLTEAAIKGKLDPLLGLKENVIIGKLIPAGTGMSKYRDIEIIDLEAGPKAPAAPREPDVFSLFEGFAQGPGPIDAEPVDGV